MRAYRLLFAIGLFVAVVAAGYARPRGTVAPATDSPGNLIVHEWGTFTTRLSAGAAVQWNPLAVPSDLPKFVFRNARSGPKGNINGTVRMETPVLYFYSDGEQVVSVDVGFPNGVLTEWYPRVHRTPKGIRWRKVAVLPNTTPSLRRETADSHYYPARETDAAFLKVRSAVRPQHEKFLFYRGVGTFDLPVLAHLADDSVVVTSGSAAVARVILFESRGGQTGYRVADLAYGAAQLPRPELAAGLGGFEAELLSILVGEGLYEREAQAMINTWRSTWSEEGLRVFYVVPRTIVDAVLPVTIEPAPSSFVRVLVGRAEIIG